LNRAAKLLALLPLGLAACAGSLFQTKVAPPTLYLLTMSHPSAADGAAPPAAALPAVLALDLAILKPRVRAGLDTDRIAILYPDRRLNYFANARWSGPLDEVFQELAIQEFHATGVLRNVSGDASAFASSYWLELEVADFQAEYANLGAPPSIHVHVLARIGAATDRRVLARFEADALEPASDNRLSAIVDAYNRATDKALAQIVASATQALETR
jgi:cholesterol transport system auxiliary component